MEFLNGDGGKANYLAEIGKLTSGAGQMPRKSRVTMQTIWREYAGMSIKALVSGLTCLLITACATDHQGAVVAGGGDAKSSVLVNTGSAAPDPGIEYLIAPGDTLQVFVWRNPELSVTVPVRPDGRISLPLVDDIAASGTRPFDLARAIEKALAYYIKEPKVTVIVTQFGGAYNQQIRVVGQATNPQALPFRKGMTLLDVMIAVGGLTEFASGNRATVVRDVDGKRRQFNVRLSDLYNNGDIRANVDMAPGDILIIPESWF